MAIWRAFLLIMLLLPVLIGTGGVMPQSDRISGAHGVVDLFGGNDEACQEASCPCEEGSCVILEHCAICSAVLPQKIEPLATTFLADKPAPTVFSLFQDRSIAPERVPPRLS